MAAGAKLEFNKQLTKTLRTDSEIRKKNVSKCTVIQYLKGQGMADHKRKITGRTAPVAGALLSQ